MGCGVRPPQGLGIKAVVYEFLVRKIGESLFLQGDDNTYSTILPVGIIQMSTSKGCPPNLLKAVETHIYIQEKSQKINKPCENMLKKYRK